ncbi:MAG: hypothetical protein AAB513_02955 [Patescibacteria group bacterium]
MSPSEFSLTTVEVRGTGVGAFGINRGEVPAVGLDGRVGVVGVLDGLEVVGIAKACLSTCNVRNASPPEPEQASVNLVSELMLKVALPEVPLEPLQPPLAIQEEALVELQEKRTSPALSPLSATKSIVGDKLFPPAGAWVAGARVAGVEVVCGEDPLPTTFTLTLLETDPPCPEQTKEYLFEEVRLPVECVPDISFVPLQSPEASQLLAFTAVQRKLTELLPICGSLTLNVRVGAGVCACSTVFKLLEQLEFEGAIAEQEPLHRVVPLFLSPQELAAELQTAPYPLGFAGIEALHWALQPIVPVIL